MLFSKATMAATWTASISMLALAKNKGRLIILISLVAWHGNRRPGHTLG